MVCEEGFDVVWVGGSSDSTLPLAVIGTAQERGQPSGSNCRCNSILARCCKPGELRPGG